MTSKELFVTGVRLFGVWQLLQVVEYAVGAFNHVVGFYAERNTAVESYYTIGSAHLVVGLYLLAGAPQVVSFFYPPAADVIKQLESPATPEV